MFRTTPTLPARRSALLAIGALALVVSTLPASADNPVGGHGKSRIDCGNGTISWTPTTVWPPNHQEVDIVFTYVDNNDDDVALTITQKLHNQVANGEELVGSGNTPFITDSLGGANTDDDGDVDVVGYVRSERSGTERGGRIYSFEYKADDGLLDGCESDADDDSDDITITVPHDCRENWCATVAEQGQK